MKEGRKKGIGKSTAMDFVHGVRLVMRIAVYEAWFIATGIWYDSTWGAYSSSIKHSSIIVLYCSYTFTQRILQCTPIRSVPVLETQREENIIFDMYSKSELGVYFMTFYIPLCRPIFVLVWKNIGRQTATRMQERIA